MAGTSHDPRRAAPSKCAARQTRNARLDRRVTVLPSRASWALRCPAVGSRTEWRARLQIVRYGDGLYTLPALLQISVLHKGKPFLADRDGAPRVRDGLADKQADRVTDRQTAGQDDRQRRNTVDGVSAKPAHVCFGLSRRLLV